MDVFYATCGDLAGVVRIEVGCWPGKVVVGFHDGRQLDALLLQVPKLHAADFWNIELYKSGTLLVAPDVRSVAFHCSTQFPAGAELLISLPNTIPPIEVIDLKHVL